MKKTLALALCVVAVSSFGASFQWGTGSTVAAFGSKEFKTAGDVGTMYLVYLPNGSVSDLFTATADSLTPTAGNMSALPATTGMASRKGKVTATFNDALVANGNVFGAYFVYNDGEKDWYNFSSTTYTVSGLNLGTETLSPAEFAFNFTSKTPDAAGTDVTAGGGWYSLKTVPEPATGALALAGVALLFKRRKA